MPVEVEKVIELPSGDVRIKFTAKDPEEKDYWQNKPHWVDFEVSWDEQCPETFKGFIKWDQCCQILIDPGTNHYQIHHDSKEDAIQWWASVMTCIYDTAEEIMGGFGC